MDHNDTVVSRRQSGEAGPRASFDLRERWVFFRWDVEAATERLALGSLDLARALAADLTRLIETGAWEVVNRRAFWGSLLIAVGIAAAVSAAGCAQTECTLLAWPAERAGRITSPTPEGRMDILTDEQGGGARLRVATASTFAEVAISVERTDRADASLLDPTCVWRDDEYTCRADQPIAVDAWCSDDWSASSIYLWDVAECPWVGPEDAGDTGACPPVLLDSRQVPFPLATRAGAEPLRPR